MRQFTFRSVCRLAMLALFALAQCAVRPAMAAGASRFTLNGSATLVPDAPTQGAAGWRLNAKLSPVTGPNVAPPAQSGGGFTLVAYTSLTSDVCYNDTIFRDDFDGDGF